MKLWKRLTARDEPWDDEDPSYQEKEFRAMLTGRGRRVSQDVGSAAEVLKGTTAPTLVNGCDELPSVAGDFGFAITNPIPVNGPVGLIVYLNRLRSRDGSPVLYHRPGSILVRGFEMPVDHYEICLPVSKTVTSLYFYMYCVRRSLRAPKGFNLVSWRSLSEQDTRMMKFEQRGSSEHVRTFPLGLASAMEQYALVKSGSEAEKAVRLFFASRVRELLGS